MGKPRLFLRVAIAAVPLLSIGLLIIGEGIRRLANGPARWPVFIGMACGVCMVVAVIYLWIGAHAD